MQNRIRITTSILNKIVGEDPEFEAKLSAAMMKHLLEEHKHVFLKSSAVQELVQEAKNVQKEAMNDARRHATEKYYESSNFRRTPTKELMQLAKEQVQEEVTQAFRDVLKEELTHDAIQKRVREFVDYTAKHEAKSILKEQVQKMVEDKVKSMFAAMNKG